MRTASEPKTTADELLTQAKPIDQDAGTPRAYPVPPAYRSIALFSLAPWQRTRVVQAAVRSANNHWPTIMAIAAWLLIMLAYYLFPEYRPLTLPSGLAIAITIAVPFLAHTLSVRRKIQQIAIAYAQDASPQQ